MRQHMKKVITLAILLITMGVGMTLYLPDFKPQGGGLESPPKYVINQDSLKSPFAMNDMLISFNDTEDTDYGLRFGLFSQLQHAIDRAKKYDIQTTLQVVKTADATRTWYVLLLGPISGKQATENKNLELVEQFGVSADIIRWPVQPEAKSIEDNKEGEPPQSDNAKKAP